MFCAKKFIPRNCDIVLCYSDIIFDSKISSSLLSNLFNACNASSIIKGTSFLKKKNKNKPEI